MSLAEAPLLFPMAALLQRREEVTQTPPQQEMTPTKHIDTPRRDELGIVVRTAGLVPDRRMHSQMPDVLYGEPTRSRHLSYDYFSLPVTNSGQEDPGIISPDVRADIRDLSLKAFGLSLAEELGPILVYPGTNGNPDEVIFPAPH